MRERHSATRRHPASDDLLGGIRQLLLRHWKDFLLFHGNVSVIEIGKASEKSFEPDSLGSRKPILAKPAPGDLFHFPMPGFRAFVLVFQPVQTRDNSCRAWTRRFPQRRKEIVFFIRGMFRRSVAKIIEGSLERLAVFGIQHSALHLGRYFQQCLQKPLDAAMTIRQESDGIRERVFFCSDGNRHR
jgi:hypothetical protein